MTTTASSTSNATISKAAPRTNAKEIARTRSIARMLSRVPATGAGQMTLSAVWSDEKVADAPTSTPTPDTIAVLLAMSACHALATIASRLWAASAPTTSAISPNRRPWTASAPKKMLATAMMITRVGASEKAAKNAIDAENMTQWSCDHWTIGSWIQDQKDFSLLSFAAVFKAWRSHKFCFSCDGSADFGFSLGLRVCSGSFVHLLSISYFMTPPVLSVHLTKTPAAFYRGGAGFVLRAQLDT